MREMKDSGIIHVGDIPKHWEMRRLRFLCSITTGNQDTQDADIDGLYPFYVRSPIIERSLKHTFYGEGVLMAGDGAGAGRIFHHAFGKYAVHQRVYRFFNFSKIQGRYAYHFLNNLFYTEMDKGSSQTTVPSVRLPMIMNFCLSLPPLDEQKGITKYLDCKCEEIDALTADIQAQIETLEQYKRSVITEAVTRGINNAAVLKDSKVFYIDMINFEWDVSKIGHICTKLSRTFEPIDTALICSNKGKVLVRDENLVGKMVSEDNAMQGIHIGDIAIHGMDTWHGAIALSEHKGKITRVVHVCDSSIDKRFVVYFLLNLAYRGVYKLISNGVRGNTSDFRSWEKVKSIAIPVPSSVREQNDICNYLDNVCRDVENITNAKKEQLSTLENYKKSLVYEYVTGKKEVPAI